MVAGSERYGRHLGHVIESTAPGQLILTWALPFELDNENSFLRVTFDIEPQSTVICLTVTHEDLEDDCEIHRGILVSIYFP